MKRIGALLVVGVALLLGAACGSDEGSGPEAAEYWPTEGWRTADAADHGIDGAALATAVEGASAELPYLDAVVVIRHGYVVYERYFNGHEADTLHDVASVTKSWTSAAVGVARERGLLGDLDQPLGELLPEYFVDGRFADKQAITLRQLLTMRSGIGWDEARLDTEGFRRDEDLLAQDLTEFGLGVPMAHEPGTAWNYSTLDTQLISAVVQGAVGESLASFVTVNLFEPLGVEQYEWAADGTGVTIGGGRLSLTPRAMAKLGFLYLHDGRWDGAQIVPEEWVDLTLTPQGDSVYYEPSGGETVIEWYGYLWWTWGPEWFHGYQSFQAQGFAGQQALVFPELDLIVVTTAHLEGVDPETAEAQDEGVFRLINEQILPALEEIDVDEG